MSYTSLIHLPTLTGIRSKCLYAPHNYIQVIWAEMLPSGVEEVNLSNNSITTHGILDEWPDGIHTLNLSNNVFTDVQRISWPLHLRSLDLSFTPLQELPSADALPVLEWLSIANTDIRRISTLPARLRLLDAVGAQLTSIAGVPDTLEILLLNRNRLESAGLPVIWGSSLRTLSLSQNRLTAIPTGLPATLMNLNLSGNRITDISELPPALRILNLERNRLRSIPGWLSSRRNINLLLEDNCITEYVAAPHILSFRFQWIGAKFREASRRIQRWWRGSLTYYPILRSQSGNLSWMINMSREEGAECKTYSDIDKWTSEVSARLRSAPPVAQEYRRVV
jgi:Leucine-rich repeat (LRR) protein